MKVNANTKTDLKKSPDFIKVVKEQTDLSKKAIGKDVEILPNHSLDAEIKPRIKTLSYDKTN